MKAWHLILLFLAAEGFSNPSHPTIQSGSVHMTHPSSHSLLVEASDGAIIHWKDFSIQAHESTRFIQPSNTAWVLNRVVGNNLSEIWGTLQANGQLILINPNGILFGKDAWVEVGGLIATCSEGGVWNQEGIKSSGNLKNLGTIRATCGDVVLVGKEVVNEGTIEVLLKTGRDTLIRAGETWSRVKAEENPYGLAINCANENANHIAYEGGKVLLKSEETTHVKGALFSSHISLLSEGLTLFEGEAHVGNGVIEISGKKGFIHNGTIEREGGTLILDPEADITISQTVNYNHNLEDGTFSPAADIVNISISKLIEEIESGPVTITTAYQGEGGGTGRIILKDDVHHTYESPYPLFLFSSGFGGIDIEGALTNTGSGILELRAPQGEINLYHTLEADHIILGAETINIPGELYGKELLLSGEREIAITGIVQGNGGDLTVQSKGNLTLRQGSLSNIGTGNITIQGLEGLPLQNINLLEGATLFTSGEAQKLIIENLEGTLLIEESAIHVNHTPIEISGTGALEIKEGKLTTHAPITIQLGRHLYLDNSQLTTLSPLNITLGSNLALTGKTLLSSPGGVNINVKGDLFLTHSSLIRGRGISLSAGENIALLQNASIDGGKEGVFISAGKDISLEEGHPKITSGQIQLHAGHSVSLENQAELLSKEGPLSLTAGHSVHLADSAQVQAQGGDLTVFSSQGSIYLYGSSLLSSKTDGATIIAGKSLIMENFSQVESFGETGTTLVVDHHGQGGGLVIAPNAAITTGESPLRIFTAKRSLNSIQGRLNGHYFTEAPQYLETSTERWGAEYPHLFFSSPFTVFHKENGLIQLIPGGVTQKDFLRVLINYIGPFTAELFRDLHPYDEFTQWSIHFLDCYSPPDPFLQKTHNFIRRRNKKDHPFLLTR